MKKGSKKQSTCIETRGRYKLFFKIFLNYLITISEDFYSRPILKYVLKFYFCSTHYLAVHNANSIPDIRYGDF